MQDIVERLKKMDTACLSDAMDSLGIECGLLGIKPVVSGVKMCGRAFTVRYVPCGSVKGTVGDFLDDIEPGMVAVLDNAGREYCTVWGDIMSYVASKKGISGTVIDGVCRDVPVIHELRYPIFTKGAYMVTGKERVHVDGINIPVSVSGVQVCPGDYIVGDDSGVVRIPADAVEKVLEKAEAIESVESKIVAAVKDGSTLKEARQKLHYHTLQSKQ